MEKLQILNHRRNNIIDNLRKFREEKELLNHRLKRAIKLEEASNFELQAIESSIRELINEESIEVKLRILNNFMPSESIYMLEIRVNYIQEPIFIVISGSDLRQFGNIETTADAIILDSAIKEMAVNYIKETTDLSDIIQANVNTELPINEYINDSSVDSRIRRHGAFINR